MRRASVVILLVLVAVVLCGCYVIIEMNPSPLGALSGRWEGTITFEVAVSSCVGKTVSLLLVLVELADGSITGTGSRMACSPPDFEKGAHFHGFHDGSIVELRYHEYTEETPWTLSGTLSGDSITGTVVGINQSGVLKVTGTWQASRESV